MAPKKGSKKGKSTTKKTKKEASPPPEENTEELIANTPAVDDVQMHVDEPQASSSTAAAEVVSSVAGPNASDKDLAESVGQSVGEVIAPVVQAVSHVVENAKETAGQVAEAATEFVDEMMGVEETTAEPVKKMTMEERKAKFNELRKKVAVSSKANRSSLVEESAKARISQRETARLDRQRKLAETLRLKADAEERGEDVERAKNWEYTIEENDEWEKKLARKRRRADFEFHDDAHAARRRYKKDLDFIKPDLEAYNKQKAAAMGLGSGALTSFSAGGPSDLSLLSEEARIASEDLYRDANTLIYGDNKPSEDAIDRVVGKVNRDIDKKGKFHRKRLNEDEGDITYINEHNRVFNKKIARYYDKYTTEIRASFERGTAL